MKEYMEIKPNRLTPKQMNEIYNLVNESFGITISEKGKKVVKGDVNSKMILYRNDIEKVVEYFKNYDKELGKLYIAWDSYDRNTFIYYLTRR